MSVPPNPASAQRDADLVLTEIGRLLDQLHLRTGRPLTLDSDLTTDLGVDSLALIELFDQLETAFGVTLADEVLLTATTPRDWLDAVRAARGEMAARAASAESALRRPRDEPWPREAETLLQALAWHVDAHPDQICLRLLETSAPGSREDVTYGELDRQARLVADALLGQGLGRGDRVAIMLPTGREYFAVFLGVLLAGAVPVPIYPPAQMAVLEAHLTRQSQLLDNAGATFLVTVPEAMVAARLVRSRVASLRVIITAGELLGAPPQALPLPAVGADDVALIQYTSGSTGDPKGVVLTQRQLVANIVGMAQAVDLDSSDVVVTWLPLYHDMGLIGCWHAPLYFGVPVVVMSPLTFLAHPVTWLEAITAQGGTISVGPNFAYQSCVDRVSDADLARLDLSSWRVAISGSEPVNAASVDRFVERFGPCGFRRETMCPAYGLAEMGVGIAFTPVGRGSRYDSVDRVALQESGRATPAPRDDPASVTFVSCGRILAGYELRIVGADGAVLPERVEGEVECRGPSATAGYYMNERATSSLWREGWLDTGDLGYLADGDLFVTGRSKDVVIRGGRKLHPEDLEQQLGEVPGVVPGGVAVVARPDPRRGTEQIVVIVETTAGDPGDREDLERTVSRRGLELLGAAPDEVVLTSPGAIVRTASGKIRRAATRDALAAGSLGRTPAPASVQLLSFGWSSVRQSLARTLRAPGTLLYGACAWIVLAPAALAALAISLVPVPLRARASSARVLVHGVARLLRIPFEVDGTFPTGDEPLIVVANHSSFIDAMALYVTVPGPAVFVTSTEIERTAVLGPVLRRFGCVFVQRGRPSQGGVVVNQLVDVVRGGQNLVVFPEGSLSGAVGLRPFHLGAFDTAVAAQRPVVPVGVRGTRAILRPGTRWPHRGAIRVVVGDPLTPSGADFAAKVALRDAARREVARLSGEDELGSD